MAVRQNCKRCQSFSETLHTFPKMFSHVIARLAGLSPLPFYDDLPASDLDQSETNSLEAQLKRLDQIVG